MRILRIMAAVRKAKPPASDRVPSAGDKQRGQTIRAFHPNSSPVYKTQSDTSLNSTFRNLSIRDNRQIRRTVYNRNGSGNGVVKNVSDVAGLLQNEAVKNVVIVAGAGISTPSGIPDFRSPGTGLYDNLQQYRIPYPEAIFDIDYFHQNPRPFFTLAKELYPSGKYRPNYIHYFVRLLHDKGMLLRMYTQNIDGLERLAGVPPEKLVEAHGTFATATCTNCGQKYEGSEVKEKIFSDRLPRCRTRGCIGIVKPDIVFFGEDLPTRFYSYMKDMLQTDLVIVMGTSLEVQPFAGIIDTVRWNVPRILFNREAVGPFRFNKRAKDVVAQGDLISNAQKFADMAGWKTEMINLITAQEGEFKVSSVPIPTASENAKNSINWKDSTENYSNTLWRRNPQLNIYRYCDDDVSSSSSSEEETESDTTSSESSEEETKKNKFRRNLNRGNRIVNNTKNGPSFRNGGGLSNSAKAGNGNQKKPETVPTDNKPVRKFSTQAAVSNGNGKETVPLGNLTGRSVKSDSGLNSNVLKRRVEPKKLEPKKLEPISSDAPKVDTQIVVKTERERVLEKYGITPTARSDTDRKPRTVETDKKQSLRDNPRGLALLQKYCTNLKSPNSLEQVVKKEKGNVNSTEDNKSAVNSLGKPAVEQAWERKVQTDTSEKSDSVREESGVSEIEEERRQIKRVSMEGSTTVTTSASDEKAAENKDANNTESKDKTATRKNGVHKSIRRRHSEGRLTGHKNEKTKKKPPTGHKQRVPKELHALNARPYGYATVRKPQPRPGAGPFGRTNVRTLNSSISADPFRRSGSAELPRINYRHKLNPPNYDARIRGPGVALDSASSDDAEIESSDDCR